MFTIPAGDNLSLGLLEPRHAVEMLAAYDANREHISSFLRHVRSLTTVEAVEVYLKRGREQWLAGTKLSLAILGDGVIIGHCSLFGIDEEGQAEIAYWIAQGAGGRGLLTQAIRALCEYAFAELNLHRLMIRCRPENIRSAAVAQRLGFTYEGLIRQPFADEGVWHDLKQFSLLSTDTLRRPTERG